jgi:DNA-binding NarL/FixJ family response regulator
MSQAPVFRLLLIDDDSIFRTGLRAACASWSEVQVAAEAATTEAALAMLATETAPESQQSEKISNVIVLELGVANLTATLPQYRSIGIGAIEFCQQLKGEYPQLPILLLTALKQPVLLSAAQQAGVEGYCPKGVKIEEFVEAVRQVAAGKTYWQNQNNNKRTLLNTSTRSLSLWGKWRYQLYRSGVQQIDAALSELAPLLKETPELSNGDPQIILNWLLLTGRRRELKAARWLVSQLLPETIKAEIRQENSPTPERQPPNKEAAIVLSSDATLTNPPPLLASELKSNLFDTTVAKFQSGLENKTNIPLETDLLKTVQKRSLFLLVLQQFERSLDELKLSEIKPQQLPEKITDILREIWQATTLDFFGKYYEVTEGDRLFEVIPVLLRDAPQIQIEILDKIPLISDLIAHLLYQTPLKIDNMSCSVGNPEAMARAEALLHNLVIQVANAVIQPLINYFADFEEVKEKYYHRRFLSTREIERFRNNLSWKYRIDKLVSEPKSIFESSYKIWVFCETGIQQKVIYAPRKSELEQLSGIPLAVTLVLESRDAVAPRVRSTIAFLGSGVVYILTQVIGRGIGLIGKGILQGIGSSLQDSQVSRKKNRQ